jgi:hypothetical protein
MKTIIATLLIISVLLTSCYNTKHVMITDIAAKESYVLKEEDFIEYVVLKDESIIHFNSQGGIYRKEESIIAGKDNYNTIHLINSSEIKFVAIKDFDTLTTVFVFLGCGLIIITIIGIIDMSTSDTKYTFPNFQKSDFQSEK